MIDEEKLIEYANKHTDGKIDANDIARFPKEDAQLVVHAHWIPEKDPDGYIHSYHCSACYERTGHYVYGRSKYCSECGAKMDGDKHFTEPTEEENKAFDDYFKSISEKSEKKYL